MDARSLRPRRYRRGFTLLELLTVVVIAGVVMAASSGRVHAVIVQQRVARAASAIQNDVEGAFAIAGRNRRPVRISWDASKLQMDVTDRAGTIAYRKLNLGAVYGLSAANVTFSPSAIEVYSNGLAGNTLTITLSVENVTKTVRTSRTGLVKTE